MQRARVDTAVRSLCADVGSELRRPWARRGAPGLGLPARRPRGRPRPGRGRHRPRRRADPGLVAAGPGRSSGCWSLAALVGAAVARCPGRARLPPARRPDAPDYRAARADPDAARAAAPPGCCWPCCPRRWSRGRPDARARAADRRLRAAIAEVTERSSSSPSRPSWPATPGPCAGLAVAATALKPASSPQARRSRGRRPPAAGRWSPTSGPGRSLRRTAPTRDEEPDDERDIS